MERVKLRVSRDIVHAVDAADCRKLILNVVQHGIISFLVVADRQRTSIILIEHPRDDISGQICIMSSRTTSSFGDLVADGPHDDAWLVDAALDHGTGIEFAPLHAGLAIKDLVVRGDGVLKVSRVIVIIAVLVFGPAIECFVDDKHAVFVADIKQYRCGRVMRHTDGVAAHVLEHLHLTLDGIAVGYRAQRALIMVHADALELHHLTIE